MHKRKNLVYSLITAVIISAGSITGGHASNSSLDIKFAGALEFSDDGTLFVGDNYNGAIYAFETVTTPPEKQVKPGSIANIDARIAELLGVNVGAVEINDIAAHPINQDIYVSVTRIGNFSSQPAIIRVSQDQQISLVDLSALNFQKQLLTEFPEGETTFGIRGMPGDPPLARDVAKGEIALRTLAIMDIEYYEGELFVAGVATNNFLSTLRRLSYPFDGSQSIANVEMYHITHDQYESRAPIRAMSVQEIDGKPQLVAAYTCSPIVLVPLDKIEDGAKISAHTIMDYGNGQPLDMISFVYQSPFGGEAEPMLFVTSDSRSPQIIPINGLQGAQVVTHDILPRGPKLDMHPLMPYGPVGKAVMFNGTPLHTTLVGGGFFSSMTRDPYTGNLNLDTNPTWFPNRIHDMHAEFDFPQYDPAASKERMQK